MDNGKHDKGWLTTRRASEVFGLSGTGFAKTVRPLIPDDAVDARGKGRPTLLYMPTVLAVWLRDRLDRALAMADTDPMMTRGDSPAMERYRAARANLAELDLSERHGKLVTLAKFQQRYLPVANRIRRAGTTLRRRFGPEAASVLEQAIDEATRAVATEPEH